MSVDLFFDMISKGHKNSGDMLKGISSKLSFKNVVKKPGFEPGESDQLEVKIPFKEYENSHATIDVGSIDSNTLITDIHVRSMSVLQHEKNVGLYLKLLSDVAETVKPEFGYQNALETPETVPSNEVEMECCSKTTLVPYIKPLSQLGLSYILSFYLLGPSFVKKYGEKNILSIPAERKVKLKYGGILLLLNGPYSTRSREEIDKALNAFVDLILSKEK